MKLKSIKVYVKILFIISFQNFNSLKINAQIIPVFDRFTLYDLNDKVYINCVISSGKTCNGIKVLRSTDSIDFFLIGEIGGVCGNSNTPVAYDFVDDNPIKNRTVYYKLELGGFGFTHILSVQVISLKSSGYNIRPNPASIYSEIYFSNKLQKMNRLSIIDNLGNTLLTDITNKESF